MCWTASAYVKKLSTAPDGTLITRSEKMLLFVLADYYNAEEHGAWASMDTIAEDAMLSTRHAQRLCKSLVACGVLGLEPRIDPLYGQRSNWYTLPTFDSTRNAMMSPRADTKAEELFPASCCPSPDLTRGDMVSPLATTRGDIAMSPPYEPPEDLPPCLPTEDIPPRGKTRTQQRPLAYSPGFDGFWGIYPPTRKKGKAEAWKVWQRDRLESQADDIVAKIAALRKYDHDFMEGFEPEPHRWLNKKRYTDDILTGPTLTRMPRASPLSRAEERNQANVQSTLDFVEVMNGHNGTQNVWAHAGSTSGRVQRTAGRTPETRLLDRARGSDA